MLVDPCSATNRRQMCNSAYLSLLLVVCILGGCGLPQTTAKASGTPSLDAQTVLQRVAQASFQNVTFTYSEAWSQGQPAQSTGDGAVTTSPRRWHVTEVLRFQSSCHPATGDQTTSERVIDEASNTTYIRVSGGSDVSNNCKAIGVGPWRTIPGTLSNTSSVDVTGLARVAPESLATARNTADETRNGVGVYHLQISASTTTNDTHGTPITTTTTNDIFVRRDTAHVTEIVTRVITTFGVGPQICITRAQRR
jgi:hypothetical protein